MPRLLLLLPLLLPAATQDAIEKQVDEILSRLAADDIDVRETAARDLVGLGPEALPILRRRGESLQGEARGRIEDAVRRIEQERKRVSVLPRLRLVTLEAKDRPAKEVFEEIARQAGVAVDFAGGPPDGALSLSLKDAAPFHAFDEACRLLGDHSFEPQHGRQADEPDDDVTPERSKAPRVVIQAGAGPAYPAALVRHYRLRVTQVTVTRTVDFRLNRSNAYLQMEIHWLPGARPLGLSRFEAEEAIDEQGRSLLKDKPEGPRGFAPRFHRGHFGFRSGGFPHSLQLPVPPADAAKIAVLRGTAVFSYPAERRILLFEKPADQKGKSLEVDGVKVTLKDYRVSDEELQVSLDILGQGRKSRGMDADGGPFSSEDVQVLTASGKRLGSRGMSGTSGHDLTSWTLTYALPAGETVKEIRIPCVLERFEDEVKFEIRDIPLPR